MSVEKTVQNLRVIEKRQTSTRLANKADVSYPNNSTDFPAAMTPGKEKHLLFCLPLYTVTDKSILILSKATPMSTLDTAGKRITSTLTPLTKE